MTAQDIITKFELQMDDSTDLSSDEELYLLNKVYRKICSDRPWEFLKKAYVGTTSGSVPYISLPSDFQYITQNYNYTDSSYEASRPVVFIGSSLSPYQLVSWSDRRRYSAGGYCYLDIANNRLYFTSQPSAGQSIEFDYVASPTTLTLADTPVIPERFVDMIYHAMCVEDNVIQQSDKAKSYAQENQQLYKSYFDDMCYWNANLIQL